MHTKIENVFVLNPEKAKLEIIIIIVAVVSHTFDLCMNRRDMIGSREATTLCGEIQMKIGKQENRCTPIGWAKKERNINENYWLKWDEDQFFF